MSYEKPKSGASRRPAAKRPGSKPYVSADDRFYSRPRRSERPAKPARPEPELLPENEEAVFIAGRNPVMEALKTGENLDTVFIEKGQTGGSMSKVIALAKQAGCPVKEVTSQKLDGMAGGTSHQGVVLSVSAAPYAEVEDILAKAKTAGEKPFLIIADEVEDPHNLGAIIRTAETAGAHGVIIPKRRGVGLTSAVFKASAGAAAHIPVARVANLASTVDELKGQGLWIYGCDMEGQTWCEVNFDGGVALIIGSEGRGMSHLLKEKCDVMVSLPMRGEITSLNASVAGGIIMYEVARQRLGLKAAAPRG